MLVLLPPSEGKASSGRGAPLKSGTLSLPGLADAREAFVQHELGKRRALAFE